MNFGCLAKSVQSALNLLNSCSIKMYIGQNAFRVGECRFIPVLIVLILAIKVSALEIGYEGKLMDILVA